MTTLIILNDYEFPEFVCGNDPDREKKLNYLRTTGHHDTALRIAASALDSGETVYVMPRSYFRQWHGDTGNVPVHRILSLDLREGNSQGEVAPAEYIRLHSDTLHSIWMRMDPPASHLGYQQALDLCEIAERNGILVVNPPSVLRGMHEKLCVYAGPFAEQYPQFIAPVIASTDVGEITDFWQQQDTGLILKPLNGFGGTGVKFIAPDLPLEEAEQHIADYLADLPPGEVALAQKYLKGIRANGDVRMLLELDPATGKVVQQSAVRRVNSDPNSANPDVVNMAAGGQAMPFTSLPPHLQEAFDRDWPKLLDALQKTVFKANPGLRFVGLDLLFMADDPDAPHPNWRLVIGEINNTAPTLTFEAEKFTGYPFIGDLVHGVQRDSGALLHTVNAASLHFGQAHQ